MGSTIQLEKRSIRPPVTRASYFPKSNWWDFQ